MAGKERKEAILWEEWTNSVCDTEQRGELKKTQTSEAWMGGGTMMLESEGTKNEKYRLQRFRNPGCEVLERQLEITAHELRGAVGPGMTCEPTSCLSPS